MIDELTLYSFKTDPLTSEVLPVLADKDNHVIDALRYALEGARRAANDIAAVMRLALTDEERCVIWTVAEAYAENDGDPECERIARIMQGLWQRTK